MACGYWNNEEATAASFGAVTKAGRGPYLRSGDLGFYQDGELYVAGRIKDVIILRGKNHYPQDIEETVESSYPSIRRGCSAAFSVVVDDEERLVVVAEVDPKFVPKKDALPGMKSLGAEFAAVGEDGVLPFAPDSIIGNLRAAVSLNHGATVFGVALIAPRTIPKTSSGKIQRSSARKHYLDRALEPLAEHRDP